MFPVIRISTFKPLSTNFFIIGINNGSKFSDTAINTKSGLFVNSSLIIKDSRSTPAAQPTPGVSTPPNILAKPSYLPPARTVP